MPIQLFYSEYIDKLRSLHDQVRTTLSGLPQEALDWSPSPGINSLAVLAVHTAGAYRYWFSDVIAGIPSGRDRETEFKTTGQTVSEIMEKLDLSLELVQTTLSGFSIEELTSTRLSPRDQKSFTVGRVMLHIYEHTALHLGHMQITRQLWEASHLGT